MTDLEAHLAGILANPDDVVARWTYADHLDDAGGDENCLRAEFIRVQLSLTEKIGHVSANISPDAEPEILELAARSDELSSRRELLMPLARAFGVADMAWRIGRRQLIVGESRDSVPVTFAGGFVEHLPRIPWRVWQDHGEAILAVEPIRSVHLTHLGEADREAVEAETARLAARKPPVLVTNVLPSRAFWDTLRQQAEMFERMNDWVEIERRRSERERQARQTSLMRRIYSRVFGGSDDA